jgi:hypothetical protein
VGIVAGYYAEQVDRQVSDHGPKRWIMTVCSGRKTRKTRAENSCCVEDQSAVYF